MGAPRNSASAPRYSRRAAKSRRLPWVSGIRTPSPVGGAKKSARGCSRLSLNVALVLEYRVFDALEHRIHIGIGIHYPQEVRRLVVLDQRLGLRLVHLQALADDLFLVVRPLNQTMLALGRRRGIHIEHLAAVLADSATGEALEQNLEIKIQQHDGFERRAQLLQHLLQTFGLGEVAG